MLTIIAITVLIVVIIIIISIIKYLISVKKKSSFEGIVFLRRV